MNKPLTALLIAVALSSTGAFAEDKFHMSMENGKRRILDCELYTLNGNEMCPMLDDRMTCEPKL